MVLDTSEINLQINAQLQTKFKEIGLVILMQLPGSVKVVIILTRSTLLPVVPGTRSCGKSVKEMGCVGGAIGRWLAVNCHPRKSRNTWSFTVDLPLTSTISTKRRPSSRQLPHVQESITVSHSEPEVLSLTTLRLLSRVALQGSGRPP